MMRDLHILPKIRDGWRYLYLEHCRVGREDNAIVAHDKEGRVPVPCTMLSLLMLGPGTSVTHAAISVLADSGCLVAWCGEQGIRFYAAGMGETRSASVLLRQVKLVSNPQSRLRVVAKMYEARFDEPLEPGLTLQQIRGKEGARVRAAYSRCAREFGVEWHGRNYDRSSWGGGDPLNRALSAANSCLYGVCHSAIISIGLSPALGFIHTGKMLSFVYDVADLYKTQVTIPAAFQETARDGGQLESRVRRACRDKFSEIRLLGRIVSDLQGLLELADADEATKLDDDAALPGQLWDPGELVPSGINYDDHEGPER